MYKKPSHLRSVRQPAAGAKVTLRKVYRDPEPIECLLSLVGPRGAVLVDALGNVERIVHREFPSVDLDAPIGGGL